MKIENLYHTASVKNNPLVSTSNETNVNCISSFEQFLYGLSPKLDNVTLTPHDFLMKQAAIFWMTSSIELTAKVAGSVTQSINKLVNIT